MAGEALNIFISYSHWDEKLKDELVNLHLKPLKREGKVNTWQDRDIAAGAEWAKEIKDNLEKADIVLLLITRHFLASDYCYETEMQRAVQRHYEGTTRVIPIILETCGWMYSDFKHLQVLPKDGKPVTSWANQADAFFDVEEGIRRVVNALNAERQEQERLQREADQLRQQQEAAERQAQEKQRLLAAALGVTSSELTIAEFQIVKVSETGNIIERQQWQVNNFRENLGNGIDLDVVNIPAGEFVMGSPPEENRAKEGPQRTVSVPRFFMGRFQVTQAQYEAVMGENPSNFKGANRPVEQVSWNDAVAFCEKLSEMTGRTYRLPSEAEWEYACRAGTTTPFHFGPTITTDLANYRGTDWEFKGNTYSGQYGNGPKGIFREKTTGVGTFPANAFGLYDMHGNVWEWCQDVWHDNYEGAPTDGSAWLEGGDQVSRVLRGGSWYDDPEGCRSAFRFGFAPGGTYDVVGFRVVCGGA